MLLQFVKKTNIVTLESTYTAGGEFMADLMDGRTAAGIKAKILADAQESTPGKPITTTRKICAIIAMIVLAAILIGIYVVPFLLN